MNTTTEDVSQAEAPVANLDEQRAKAEADPKKKKGEQPDTVETWWSRHVGARKDLGVYFEDKDVPIPYKYTGTHWKSMSIADTRNLAEEFMSRRPKDYSASKVKSCEYLFESILQRNGRTKSLDRTRARFAMEHGILESRIDGTFIVRPHDRNIFCRTFIPLSYGFEDVEDAIIDGEKVKVYTPKPQEEIEATGLLGKFICDSFPDVAVRRAFQESFGDTLLPGNSQTTPFLIANGGQGKSQWAILAMGMHPQYAIADLSNLRGFALASFIGSSILIVDEAEKRIDESAFKRIFGGGVGVQVDRKFKTPLNWVPDIKGLACVNEIPAFAEHSEGMDRRIRPFPMGTAKHNAADVIIDIGKKIVNGYLKPGANPGEEVFVPSQLRDLIDWALEGARRVLKRGRLLQEQELPEACRMAKTEMRMNSDPVQEFIVEFDWQPIEKGGISKQELYDLYVSWTADKGRTAMNQTNFGRDFRRVMQRMRGVDLKEGQKISVKGPKGEVWKPALRVKSMNPIAEVKGSDYVWDEAERARDEAEVKRKLEETERARKQAMEALEQQNRSAFDEYAAQHPEQAELGYHPEWNYIGWEKAGYVPPQDEDIAF